MNIVAINLFNSSLNNSNLLDSHHSTNFKASLEESKSYDGCAPSGASINCILNENTLTISGNGKMRNFSSSSVPWYSDKKKIYKVIIDDGVTTIGHYSFYICPLLKEVTVGKSVSLIGYSSFYQCNALRTINIPDSVKVIGDSSFAYCDNLTDIDM